MENKLTTEKVVDVKDLHISFRTFKGYPHVLNGVNVHVNKKERISIVGETGCGKTTTVNAIAQILARQARIDKGEIYFKGKDVLTMPQKELKRLRAENVSIIFQDPIASLNPVFTIGQQLKEVIRYSGIEGAGDKKVQEEKAIRALKETSLPDPERIMDSYPFQLSGGMRQRICIARALALNPEFIVCDEPVSALDVSIQAQIINLLRDLQKERGLTYLFISHDLSVVEHISDTVGVMYLGGMVESGETADIFGNPLHPYTKALFSAIPMPDPDLKRNRIILEGNIPSPANPPKGCKFHTRCRKCMEICKNQVPEVKDMGNGHKVRCHLYD